MTQAREGAAHLISKRAFMALSSEMQAVEKLRTIDDMSFDDMVIFRAAPVKVINGRARKAYAIPFSIMKETSPRKVAMMSVRDRAKDVFDGYISFYVFNGADEETIYAFYQEELAAVVLLVAMGDVARDEAMRFIMHTSIRTSAGKVCCECGARAPQGGPKLKKCPCKKVRYCSRECQTAHWAAHRCCCSRCNE
jgi:hypothetical protein